MGLAEIGAELLMATMHRRYFYGSWTTRERVIGGSWGGERGVYLSSLHSPSFFGVVSWCLYPCTATISVGSRTK